MLIYVASFVYIISLLQILSCWRRQGVCIYSFCCCCNFPFMERIQREVLVLFQINFFVFVPSLENLFSSLQRELFL